MGARPVMAAALLLLHERLALVTVLLTAFGRAISEVGAVMIVGGNIDGVTRVMTTTIALETSKGDLALALGCRPDFDNPDPKAAQAIDHIIERAKAHGVVAGVHNGLPEVARARAAKGFRFVTVGSDAKLLAAGSQQMLSAMRAPQA